MFAIVPGSTFALSPDGKSIVTDGDRKGNGHHFDAITGKSIGQWKVNAEISGHPAVSEFAFTADGKQIITIGVEGTYGHGGLVTWWSLPKYNEVRRVGPVGDMRAFSPTGNRIIVRNDTRGSQDFNKQSWWDLTTGQSFDLPAPLKDVKIVYRDPAMISPDGKLVAVTDNGTGIIGLWDIANGRMMLRLTDGRDRGTKLAFTNDGKKLASVRLTDDIVEIWDTATGQLIGEFRTGQGSIAAIAFSSDGTRIAVGGADTTTLLFDWQKMIAK